MDRRPIALVACVLVVAAGVPLAAANTIVIGQPDLSVSSPTGPVRASAPANLTVVVANEGDLQRGDPQKPDYERQVTAATNVRVRIAGGAIDAPIDVNAGTQSVGTLPSGAARRFSFPIEVGRASPGTYRIPVVIEYKSTRAIDYDRFEQPEFTETTETVRTEVTLRVDPRPQFAVDSPGGDSVFAGDDGTLRFELTNVGSRPATDATVRLSAGAPDIYLGPRSNPQSSTTLYVDELPPGASVQLAATVGAGADVAPGSYPVEITVNYENRNGVRERSDPLTLGVTVEPDRRFSLRNVTTEQFRVDEGEARVNAEIVNVGDAIARNVAVRLDAAPPVTPTNGETAVGDLAPGEAAPVTFTVDIAGDAEPGTNTFPFTVEYENTDGDVLTATNPLRQSIRIAPERDPFEVRSVATDLTPGGDARLDLRVRYVGDRPASAVNAKLFASDPLSSSDDGAFLGSLAPNETATASFRVAAVDSALTKEYDATVEFRYDEPDGDTRFTDGRSIGVPVTAGGGGFPLLPVGVVLVVVVAAAGYLRFGRR